MDPNYPYNPDAHAPYPYQQSPVFYPPYQMRASAPTFFSQRNHNGAIPQGDRGYAGQSAGYHAQPGHFAAAGPPIERHHGNQASQHYSNSSVDAPRLSASAAPFNPAPFFQDANTRKNARGRQPPVQQQRHPSRGDMDRGNFQGRKNYSCQPNLSSQPRNDTNNAAPSDDLSDQKEGVIEGVSTRGRGQRNRGRRNGGARMGNEHSGWGREESMTNPRIEKQQGCSQQRNAGDNEHYADGWTGHRGSFPRSRPGRGGPHRGAGFREFHNSNFDDGGVCTGVSQRGNRRGRYSQNQSGSHRGNHGGVRNDRTASGWTLGGSSRDVHGNNTSSGEETTSRVQGMRRGVHNERGGGRRRHVPSAEELDVESQRGLLIEQLSAATYECMVCCEVVGCASPIWSCDKCYHIFHLHCIKRWARSPTAAEVDRSGWRCPACQNVTQRVPHQYRCFCDKMREPDWRGSETPHSCGEVCGKQRPGGCPHPCNLLCHPGPCPPCQASVTKSCNCGKTKQKVKCDQGGDVKCEKTCEKTLNCGKHPCTKVCHSGSCDPCHVTIEQECYCRGTSRTVVCGASESFVAAFSCDKTCNSQLLCCNHRCDQCCHPGACSTCTLLPSVVTHCPCGETPLSELTKPGQERTSCTDVIPTCALTCDKELACGPSDARHHCQQPCHQGECGVCDGITEVTCRCRSLTKEVPCSVALKYTGDDPFKCDRRCSKKKHCGRHRCSRLCCVDTEHRCDQICGGKLSCGLHRCEEPCHRGNCPTCWQVSFDELRCHCGAEVIYPPVACGTLPPECRRPCNRQRPCGHRVSHPCHIEETCPPCTQLTGKMCMGGHVKRNNIPCHLTNISCGLPCGRQLVCGQHKCQRNCHKGECLADGQTCKQPCVTPRGCGHACNEPCHAGHPCPQTSCKTEVTLTCVCGFRTDNLSCWQHTGKEGYQKLATSMLALQMKDSDTIDISNLTQEVPSRNKHLECNQACAQHERNQRVALALEIKNPDLSSKLGHPPYPQFIKEFAKHHAEFVNEVEKAMSLLVNTAQQSKLPKRSHSFAPMSFEQRRVVHALAEFYGCETQSYDTEPKKNIVAIAYKNKCWHPTVTVSALVGNSSLAPIPFRHTSAMKLRSMTAPSGRSGSPVVPEVAASAPITSSWASTLKAKSGSQKSQPETTDYFEMTE